MKTVCNEKQERQARTRDRDSIWFKKQEYYMIKRLYYIENTSFLPKLQCSITKMILCLCQTLSRSLHDFKFERRDTSQMSYLDLLFVWLIAWLIVEFDWSTPTCFPSLSLYRHSHAYDVCEGAWHTWNAWDVWSPFGTDPWHVMHDSHLAHLSSHVWR